MPRSFFRLFAASLWMIGFSVLYTNNLHAQMQISSSANAPKEVMVSDSDERAWEQRRNLGPTVNTKYSELFPVLTPDGLVLYFTRKGTPDNAGYAVKPDDEDIWYSLKQADGSWSEAKRLEGPLNTATYDGVRAVNYRGDHLYLQNIYRKDGSRGKGFSVSIRTEDGLWQFPEALEIDGYHNDTNISMMTVSNDEKTIIFSLMHKDDGKGRHDLYVSHCLGGYHWSKPTLITELSTAGDEISPFIAYDDRTLYYSTDGLGGFGLHDVFVVHRLDSAWLHWSKPVNLGSPINTPSFDAYLMVTAQGDTAYFSSVHQTSTRGFGKSDIWKFGLADWQRPGFQLPCCPSNPAKAANPGFFIDPDDGGKSLAGTLFRLENVFFDVDKYSLREESQATLDKLVVLMNQYPGMEIEVQGHTDSDASPEHNLTLSHNRAGAVRQYLIDHGINENRIEATGYGETRPIASNATAEGKQLNRRVMVLIRKN